MDIEIQIQDKIILFPESSESPNWAPAMVEFAQAVEAALTASAFDVAPQTLSIDSRNGTGTFIDIPNLEFSSEDVSKVIVDYTVSRLVEDPLTVNKYYIEGGRIEFLYSPEHPAGNKWQKIQERVNDASIEFYMTDTGQVQFKTEELGAVGNLVHDAFISFRARTLTQES